MGDRGVRPAAATSAYLAQACDKIVREDTRDKDECSKDGEKEGLSYCSAVARFCAV